MGWFEEQIKQRKKYSDDAFEKAFYKIADAVTGKNVAKAMQDDAKRTEDAIEAVLKYYKVKRAELPNDIKNVYEQIDYLTRPNGMMRRDVYLTKGWYRVVPRSAYPELTLRRRRRRHLPEERQGRRRASPWTSLRERSGQRLYRLCRARRFRRRFRNERRRAQHHGARLPVPRYGCGSALQVNPWPRRHR